MDKKSSYIKTDEDIFINEQSIVWVKKINDCLAVGTPVTGSFFNTYKICKLNNLDSYNRLYDKIKDGTYT